MGDAHKSVPGSQDQPPWFNDVLEVIEQFGVASIGLVAWELFLGEEELVPAWRDATILGFVERVGRCPFTREPMYRLTRPLRELSKPTSGDAFSATFLGTTAAHTVTRLTEAPAASGEREEAPQPI